MKLKKGVKTLVGINTIYTTKTYEKLKNSSALP